MTCPACGGETVAHCAATSCTWWRCPDQSCLTYGDATRHISKERR